MEDENDIIEIDPNTGEFIPASRRFTSGNTASQGSTIGYSTTVTNSESSNSGTSEKTKKVDPELLEHNLQYVQTMPHVTGVAEEAPEVREARSATFRDAMRRADEQRQRRAQTYLDEGDRLRKKGRYLAWTDFLNSLGQIAGQGYAPVRPYDNSRTLKAFDDLDKMRLAAEQVKNDDSLNWIEKLRLQEQIQTAARDKAAQLQAQKINADIDKVNAKALNDAAKMSAVEVKDYSGRRTTSGNSVTNYGSQTQRTGSSSSVSDTYYNPDYLTARAQASLANKAIRIGGNRSFDTPISGDEAASIVSLVGTAMLNYDSSNPQPSYFIPLGKNGEGVTISRENMAALADNLGQLSRNIEASPSDPVVEAREYNQFIQGLDAMSGYTLSDYYRRNGFYAQQQPARQASPAQQATPASAPVQPAAQATQPTASTQQAGSKWKRNK